MRQIAMWFEDGGFAPLFVVAFLAGITAIAFGLPVVWLIPAYVVLAVALFWGWLQDQD
jgi:hypothetical protein